MTTRRRTIAAILVAAIAGLGLLPATAASAASYEPISGAGSSWSFNAIDQWRRNVEQYGMKINYASTGSSDGRNQFKNGTTDFAVSEIPYGITDGGVVDSPPTVGYAYMPIVAGGTSFMYNLEVGGKRVTNLRLSGSVIAKIFTGRITSWDDPAIAADNVGIALPKRQIVPVVRSDGSGSTAQFATWLSKQHASDWDAYCAAAGRSTPCGVTSNFPTIPGKGFIAQPNSQGVAGYVAQKANIGTITYVEYSYALKANFPVAKVLNEAGYYVEPTASNVAVGLLGAKINSDPSSGSYLTQILDGVFNNADPRAYPLSSYSYMIVPTSAANTFTAEKGKTLGAFANYFLCEGQQQAEVLGYSPLPINLVQAGLEQVAKIPGSADTRVDIKDCNNPTFSKDGTNVLAANAPQPQECDKKSSPICGTVAPVATATAVPTAAVTAAVPGTTAATGTKAGTKPGTKPATKPANSAVKPGSEGDTKTDTAEAATPPTPSGAAAAAPLTGTGAAPEATTGEVEIAAGDAPLDTTVVEATGPAPLLPEVSVGGPVSCEADTGVCANVVALPVELASNSQWGSGQSLMLATVAALIGLVVIPPLLGLLIGRRKARR